LIGEGISPTARNYWQWFYISLNGHLGFHNRFWHIIVSIRGADFAAAIIPILRIAYKPVDMVKEVSRASEALPLALGVSIEVCILPLERTSCMFAFLPLAVRKLIHFVLDMLPQYVAIRETIENI